MDNLQSPFHGTLIFIIDIKVNMEAQSALRWVHMLEIFATFLLGIHSEMAEARTRDCQQTFYHPGGKQNKNIFMPLQMRIISSF